MASTSMEFDSEEELTKYGNIPDVVAEAACGGGEKVDTSPIESGVNDMKAVVCPLFDGVGVEGTAVTGGLTRHCEVSTTAADEGKNERYSTKVGWTSLKASSRLSGMLSQGVEAVAGEGASVRGGLSPLKELMLVCLEDRRESLVFSFELEPLTVGLLAL